MRAPFSILLQRLRRRNGRAGGGRRNALGIYDQGGTLKPAFHGLLPDASPMTLTNAHTGTSTSAASTRLGLGKITSEHRYGWLTVARDTHLAYPPETSGSIFITFGHPVPAGTAPIDFGGYGSLVLDMRLAPGRSAHPGRVRLGVKDRTQPDNGRRQPYQNA